MGKYIKFTDNKKVIDLRNLFKSKVMNNIILNNLGDILIGVHVLLIGINIYFLGKTPITIIYMGISVLALGSISNYLHEKFHQIKCDKLNIESQIIKNNKCIIKGDKFHSKQNIIKALLYPLRIQIIVYEFIAMVLITLNQNLIFIILNFINMLVLAIARSARDIIDCKMLSKFSDYKYCKMDISEFDTEMDTGNIYYVLKKELY
ncbi:MAG: hypothetical protein KID00_12425 [Clostridium argentinense]|nr:hypothetical protein [Clostridium argentinense]